MASRQAGWVLAVWSAHMERRYSYRKHQHATGKTNGATTHVVGRDAVKMPKEEGQWAETHWGSSVSLLPWTRLVVLVRSG